MTLRTFLIPADGSNDSARCLELGFMKSVFLTMGELMKKVKK